MVAGIYAGHLLFFEDKMNFIRKAIYLVILITIKVFGYSADSVDNNLTAKFVLQENTCNSCCIEAINFLSKEFIDYGISKQIIYLDPQSSKLKPLLKYRCRNIDSIAILNKEEFEILFPNSGTEEVFIANEEGINYFHFTSIRDTKIIVKTLDNSKLSKEYHIKLPEYTVDIFSPYITNDNSNAFLIDPYNNIIYNYSLIQNSIVKVVEPDKDKMFTYYDSIKHSKEIWEMTFEGMPSSFIHFYFIYEDKSGVNSYISILNDYDYDTTKKKVMWSTIPSKFSLNQNKISRYRGPLDRLYVSLSFSRLYSYLNDSLFIFPTHNASNNSSGFSTINLYNDSITFYDTKNNFNNTQINPDSLIFCANNFNKLILLNFNNYSIDIYKLDKDGFIKDGFINIINDNKLAEENTQYTFYDIMSYFDKLYLFYLNNKNNLIYVEEYSINDLSFLKAFTLSNNKEYLQNINFIKVDNSNIFMTSFNKENQLLLQNFFIEN